MREKKLAIYHKSFFIFVIAGLDQLTIEIARLYTRLMAQKAALQTRYCSALSY